MENKYMNNPAEYLGCTDEDMKICFGKRNVEQILTVLSNVYPNEENKNELKLLAKAIYKSCNL